ncbi:MAG: hypothetical protein JWL77_2138 [Chthonomonadaceae bacterium]|nr:hypothetical protein [Chthonomonadaceae bacterium]
MGELEVSESELYRCGLALVGAAVAVATTATGLHIGRLELVPNGTDDVTLACGILAEIGRIMVSEEAISTTPMSLLKRYAVVLQAQNTALDLMCYAFEPQIGAAAYRLNVGYLLTIAKHVVASSFPHPLNGSADPGQEADINLLENLWLKNLRHDVEGLLEDLACHTAAIGNALFEGGSVSADEMKFLADACCNRRVE